MLVATEQLLRAHLMPAGRMPVYKQNTPCIAEKTISGARTLKLQCSGMCHSSGCRMCNTVAQGAARAWEACKLVWLHQGPGGAVRQAGDAHDAAVLEDGCCRLRFHDVCLAPQVALQPEAQQLKDRKELKDSGMSTTRYHSARDCAEQM